MCCDFVFTMLTIFFFNDTATTEIYTLSLHDALPISSSAQPVPLYHGDTGRVLDDLKRWTGDGWRVALVDRKSTRLNSSHGYISYAVFCLKKKNEQTYRTCSRRLTVLTGP